MSLKNSTQDFYLCWDINNCWDVGNQTSKQTVGASYAFIYQIFLGSFLYISPLIMRYLCPSTILARLGVTGFIIHLLLAILNWTLIAIKSIFHCTCPPKFSLISETRMHKMFVKASTSAAVFFSHIRTEENFMHSNTEVHNRPPKATAPCRERMMVKHWSPFRILGMGTIFDYSLGLAFISGGLGSLIILFYNYAAFTEEKGDQGNLRIYIDGLGVVASELIKNFKFFPVFLLFGYLGYSVTLWRRFVEQGTLIQGRIHDICIMLGGSIIDPYDIDTRKFLYRIYRYVTVAHFLCYSSLNKKLSEKKIEDLVDYGLLTANEVQILQVADNKARDTICGWISQEIQERLRNGKVDTTANAPLVHSIARYRGYLGQLHDFFDFANPNIWASNMMLVVNTNIILLTLGLPWILYIKSTTVYAPWITTFAVFISCLCYWTTIEMIVKLENCYDGEEDVINPDSFIAGSEQTAFALLRIRFDDKKRLDEEKITSNKLNITISE
jgi:hypothetical protein